ncbi:tripartite tricarboxylate transporter permease [Polycladidibacter stylochi]|uniref:tripartite tricarboxylate transporter permease n=1 Tax=Polycladidibacter stylochi TaxID=1807766 RepID=UPI00082D1420|nr:tripartite tricarboxylate transporter permease [Pseudovibrio stylochi]
MDVYVQAMEMVFRLDVFLTLLAGGAFGLFMGAMPGLTSTMAMALLVPVTFFLPPVPALALMVAASSMAIFSGDLPGALMRIPGTPASAAYCEDTYYLTKTGRASIGLGLGLGASVVGGMAGALILSLSAPLLAKVALNFSSYEYFWLACLGLTCATLVSQSTAVKGLVSLLIGLLAATVGLDATTGFPRFTFGLTEMMGGISFIPAMIGMFAVAELISTILRNEKQATVPQYEMGSLWKVISTRMWHHKANAVRGSLIGTLVGALPGAGADIAAWVSYAIAKKLSKKTEEFGKGTEEGIVAASSSNNSSIAGGWIPTLVFGIPGDSGAAIIIGVLYLKDLAPGPTLFLYKPEVLYAVFATFFIANILLFLMGTVMIKLSSHILKVPYGVLAPCIMMFCVVGAFAMNNSYFGVAVMMAAGVLAWFMKGNGIPVAPAILGMVLGNLLEKNFLTSMVKANGDPLLFFSRPISAALGIVTILIWCLQIYSSFKSGRRHQQNIGNL